MLPCTILEANHMYLFCGLKIRIAATRDRSYRERGFEGLEKGEIL
jgi:hypothetical protein